MALINPSEYKRKRPWLVFLMLTFLFFVGFHNLYSSKIQYDVSDSQAGDQSEDKLRRYGLYLGIVVFSMLSLAAKPRNAIAFRGLLGGFAGGLVFYSSMSVLWAEDRGLTTMKVLLLLIFSLGALAAVRRFSAEDILWFVLILTGSNLLVGLTAEVAVGAFHPLEQGYRFSGTMGPSRFGLNSALLLLASLGVARIIRRARPLFSLLAFVALAFLIMSGSRTAFASALVAFVAYRLLVTPLRAQLLSLTVLLVSLCLFLLLSLERAVIQRAEDVFFLGRPASDTVTMTGRVPLWQDCMDFVAKRPLLGYGYGSFWTEDRAEDFAARWHWEIGGAHSAYLEILLDLGILGLTIYVGVLLLSLFRCIGTFRRLRDPTYAFIAAMLFVFVLDGVLESVVVTYPSSLSFLAMIAVAHLALIHPRLKGIEYT